MRKSKTVINIFRSKILMQNIIKMVYMHLESGSKKIPPGKITTHQTPPLENFPRKIPTQKIPTWNIPTHFINCLSSLFLHLILRP